MNNFSDSAKHFQDNHVHCQNGTPDLTKRRPTVGAAVRQSDREDPVTTVDHQSREQMPRRKDGVNTNKPNEGCSVNKKATSVSK